MRDDALAGALASDCEERVVLRTLTRTHDPTLLHLHKRLKLSVISGARSQRPDCLLSTHSCH